jgi:glycosyltransferase involved in cell wall biosynthesis
MTPIVSCILPTYNRPEFFRQALRCYLRQTWENSELVVVDDGEESVESLCQGLFRVRYVRLNERTSLGSKLNRGIEEAKGELIQKLDDDDYYHPEFLERGVNWLLRGPEQSIVAWDCFQILLAGEDRVRLSGHGWAAGGTLLFPRTLWQKAPFRNVPRGVDYWFLQDHPGALRKICAPELYLLVRHGGNTWTTMRGSSVDDQFNRLPRGRKLAEAIEPLDEALYRSLRARPMLEEVRQ